MNKNNKGFVLMETVTVITIVCVIFAIFYESYSDLLVKASTTSLYDNTEYIYKTMLIKDFLQENIGSNLNLYNNVTYCQNSNSDIKCYDKKNIVTKQDKLFNFLKVEAVYITDWDVTNLAKSVTVKGFNFDATTQKYIKHIENDDNNNWRRIIVMFAQENSDNTIVNYEYASLRY